MHQFIDNLNVAYVAFTRAKHELICVAPIPKSEPESVEKINSLAGLLLYSFQNSIENHAEINLTENFNQENQIYKLGDPTTYTYPESKTDDSNEKLENYPSVSTANRLQIRHQSLNYWLESQNLTDSRLNYGIIMHDILRNITRKSDQSKAIHEMISEGRINENESKTIIREMEKFWALPETSDWFADDVRVLNEATILTPTGDLYRPDRVVFRNKQAIVVDYKFGDKENDSYLQQVKQYMELITGMGYEVSGYVCYVSLEKVVGVK